LGIIAAGLAASQLPFVLAKQRC